MNTNTRTIVGRITQEEAIDLVKANDPKHYRKKGRYSYRVATELERIHTILSDGQEAENDALPGDYIMAGVSGEVYVISPKKFQDRYHDLGNGVAEAKGEAWGNQYRGPSIELGVPLSWNDPTGVMPLHNGDYLISSDAVFSEAYRVKREEFESTYEAVN